MERKTADKFLTLLKDAYEIVQREWKVTIAAVVTDASGETRKARQDFIREFPSVVVLDCYAHQVSYFLL